MRRRRDGAEWQSTNKTNRANVSWGEEAELRVEGGLKSSRQLHEQVRDLLHLSGTRDCRVEVEIRRKVRGDEVVVT